MSEYKNTGLSKDEVEAALSIQHAILTSPQDIDAIITLSGQKPDPDPTVKFFQFLEAKAIDSKGFDANVMKLESRQAIGALVAALLPAAGKLVKKIAQSDGAKKVVNFVKGVAGKAIQGAGKSKSAPAPAPEPAPTSRASEPPAKASGDDEKKKLETTKKTIKTYQYVTAGLAVGIIGVLIWAFNK